MFGKHGLDGKTCKANPRLPQERTHSELQKDPPPDWSGRQPLYPFYGQPISRPDPDASHLRDIWLVGQTLKVEALSEVLNECVAMAPPDLTCIFFTIQTILQEHCTCQLKMMVCNFPFYLYCVVQTSGQITSIFGQVL